MKSFINKNKREWIFSFVLFFVFLCCVSAVSASDTRITTDAKDQINPDISVNNIVYEHVHSATDHDIHMYDSNTGQSKIISESTSNQLNPAIDGNNVVWQDNRNGNWDIYAKDALGQSETRITNDAKDQVNPDIDNDHIVYEHVHSSTDHDIHMYDGSIQKTIIISEVNSNQLNPAIDNYKVVWQDNRNDGIWQIYLKDLFGSEMRVSASTSNQVNPRISQNHIVWEENNHIMFYDLNSNTKTDLNYRSTEINQNPDISGDWVTYTKRANTNAVWDVVVTDAFDRYNQAIHAVNGEQLYPVIAYQSGNVAWMDLRNGNWDIYMHPFLDLSYPKKSKYAVGEGDFSATLQGNQIKVVDTVKNIGMINSGPFYIYYYLTFKPPTGMVAKMDYLGNRHISSLNELQSNTATTLLNTNGVSISGKYIRAVIDKTGVIDEFDEDNNNPHSNNLPDVISPTVKSSDPANNAVNVARDKVIKVTFSEPIKAGSMWFELYKYSSGVKKLITLTPSISGNVLTLKHSELLSPGSKYTLGLHTGSVTDLAGNPLVGVALSFTTTPDVTPPTITSTDPANNAVNVARDKVIKVTFSEPIKAGSLWIDLVANGSPIKGVGTVNGNILTITHATLLANTKYTIGLHSGCVTDYAGNPLVGVTRSFTTGNI